VLGAAALAARGVDGAPQPATVDSSTSMARAEITR
jgi:hypothetical protein